jgi:V-type H+-transporting ATPase subunit G
MSRATTNSSDRVQKLKDARSEAAKEIEEYKASKEAEFKKFEGDVSLDPLRVDGTALDVGCSWERLKKEKDQEDE